jgi:DNA-binding response OmpR family regulator
MAEQAVRSWQPDVVLFDPTHVDAGFVNRIRQIDPSLPLIALVPAKATDAIVSAFDSGARDVLHGGMEAEEIVARLVAAARSAQGTLRSDIAIGPLVVDAVTGVVTWDGKPVPCTQREGSILAVLARHAPEPVAREAIYREVWCYAMVRGDRIVDVNVKRMRDRFIGFGSAGESIKTVAGVGYALVLPDPDDADATASNTKEYV